MQPVIRGLNLDPKIEQPVMEALQSGGTSKPTGESRDVLGASSKEIHTQTDDVIEKLNKLDLGDDIEKLVIEAFEVLIRHDDSEKSTLMLMTKFKEEDDSLLSPFDDKREDVKKHFSEEWKQFRLELAAAIHERHVDNNAETIRTLSRICAKLSRQLLQRKELEATAKERYFSPGEPVQTRPQAKDFVNVGKIFSSMKKPIHATFSFYIAARLHKRTNNGDTAVMAILRCCREARLVMNEMAKEEVLKIVISEHVISLLQRMKNFISSIQNSTHTGKIESEAWCLYSIAYCYYFCGDYQNCAKETEIAIKLLETEFGESAKNHRIYGHCLNNAGAAYKRMGNVAKAIELFEMSLKAYEKVTDWTSEESKRKQLKITQNNLRSTRAQLKN